MFSCEKASIVRESPLNLSPQELPAADNDDALYTNKETTPGGGGGPLPFVSQPPASVIQTPAYPVPVGQPPLSSLLQTASVAPGMRPSAHNFDTNAASVIPERPRMILQHEARPMGGPPGVLSQNLAENNQQQSRPPAMPHNQLAADLQQFIHSLPSMNQPPPAITNPRPQQASQAAYLPPTQTTGLDTRSSPTIPAAFQLSQAAPDFRNSSMSLSQAPPPPPQSPASAFSTLVSNTAAFHHTKQPIGQPYQPTPVRPSLSPSRSASNIPTVAETLFGDHGLSVAPTMNPLASLFSQAQPDGTYSSPFLIHFHGIE